MSIRFTRQNSELILILAPDGIEIQAVLDELDKGEDWHVCRCFSVNKKHLRKEDPDENELYFCVGTVQAEYTHIDIVTTMFPCVIWQEQSSKLKNIFTALMLGEKMANRIFKNSWPIKYLAQLLLKL